MKKLAWLQIGIAVIAFVITAWVFFRERPRAEVNQQLQQELTEVKQENKVLQQTTPVKVDREQSREYLRQGRALFHQKKYDEAIALYDKALEVFPDDPYALSLKGYALFRNGKIQESIEPNKRAIELDPGDPLNYIDLAKSYCGAKQFEDAARVLLDEPPSDTEPAVLRYFRVDGEIQRVCKPISARILKASQAVSAEPDR